MPARAGPDLQTKFAYPGIARRLICMVYEFVLLAGVAFAAGLLFLVITGSITSTWLRHAFQAYIFLAIGLYFASSWHRRGQTLPMKTWKLRLIAANGGRITVPQAILRYVCAWPSLALGGAGIFYALFDRDRQFLHDRLAGTRIVSD
ncbi:MAG: RDD family protein [Burkholderiales bacterium]|nr:RDD family protein [Burkholderiales bacterium]